MRSFVGKENKKTDYEITSFKSGIGRKSPPGETHSGSDLTRERREWDDNLETPPETTPTYT